MIVLPLDVGTIVHGYVPYPFPSTVCSRDSNLSEVWTELKVSVDYALNTAVSYHT